MERTMKAVRIHQYGGREALIYEDSPFPDVADDAVLIRVTATSVNPFDCAVRNGYVVNYFNHTLPLILGLDVAGVVEAVGAKVEDFSPGDAVYARASPETNGAYAEFIALPSAVVAPAPRSLDLIHAAAVPHVAYAAWHTLTNVTNLSGGQKVLIHGAAGGVGTFAVQLAKCYGAYVVGTSSENNLDYLRELGADEVIDYNASRFEDLVHDMDVVMDLVGDMGDNTQTRSWKVLKSAGMLASLVQFPSPEAAAEHNVQASLVGASDCDGQALVILGEMIDRGQIKPAVTNVLPLSEIRQAHEISENRHVRGKLVLTVNGV